MVRVLRRWIYCGFLETRRKVTNKCQITKFQLSHFSSNVDAFCFSKYSSLWVKFESILYWAQQSSSWVLSHYCQCWVCQQLCKQYLQVLVKQFDGAIMGCCSSVTLAWKYLGMYLGIASMDLLRFLETRRKVTNKCQITKFQLSHFSNILLQIMYPTSVIWLDLAIILDNVNGWLFLMPNQQFLTASKSWR
jgi:hypothetical protein